MALTKQQKNVAKKLIKVGKRRGESSKDIITALATGLVEANLGNPAGGHGTSVGWRQEISSYGSVENRRNVKKAAKRFYNELDKAPQGSIGSRAQAVQRSAFPGRYATKADEAKSIFRALEKNLDVQGKKAKGKSSNQSSQSVVPGLTVAQKYAFAKKENKTAGDYAAFLEAKKIAETPVETSQDKGKNKSKQQSDRQSAKGKMVSGGAKGRPEIVALGKLAQSMGLSVGEHKAFGGVDPVHASGSYHYSGRAIDVSGDPKKMAKFARRIDRLYGNKLAELFWNGRGAVNRDNGKRVSRGFVSGHTDHVHVAV